MRSLFWIVTGLLLTASAAAQPPAPPAATPAPPTDARLNELLNKWEQQMKGIQSLIATLKRIDTDDVAKTVDVYQGTLKFLRPNRADLFMQKVNNPQDYERFLCTGNFLFQFLPKQRLIRAHAMPQKAAGQPLVDNSFVGFLSGMGAAEAKQRFDMRLIKEDQWYAYIDVLPKRAEDKAEFSKARLALMLKTMMPAEMQFVPPNNAVTKWMIEKIDTTTPIAAVDFTPPQLNQLPAGWQMQQVPPPAAGPVNALPPRVARPNGQ